MDGATGRRLLLDVERYGGLQAGEREAVVSTAVEGAREVDGLGITVFRQARDDRATGISEAQRLGDLVKGLAHRVVERLAQDLVITPGAYVHKHGVSTRDEREDERRLQVGGGELIGKQVPLEVIHADERFVGRKRKALGERHAHHKRAHQTRSLGHANRRELGRGDGPACQTEALGSLLQRSIHHTDDDLHVLARGDLGNHAAKASVEIDLGRHLVGQQVALGIHNGHGRLVAGALDGEDELAALDLGRLIGRARGRRQRPFARQSGRGLRRCGVHGQNQRQRSTHHMRIAADPVVPAATTDLLESQIRIESTGGFVVGLHLERGARAAEHLRIVAHMREELTRDTLTPMCG